MIFKISDHVLKNAAEICNSLKDIETIIAESKMTSTEAEKTNLENLDSISSLI